MHAKKFLPAGLSVCLVALLCFAPGCDRPTSTSTAPASSASPPVAAAKSAVSAEPNSFTEVTRLLDPNGHLYVYLSTEQLLVGLTKTLDTWGGLLGASTGASDTDAAALKAGLATLGAFLGASGLEEISGVGVSSIATSPGFYRSRVVLHHYPDKGQGAMWTMLGRKPHPLSAQDWLPASTALATFTDLDAASAWQETRRLARAHGWTDFATALDQAPAAFRAATDLDLSLVLESLAGEIGLVVTLDPSRPVALPVPAPTPVEIPSPAVMLMLRVKNNLVFDRLERAAAENPQVIRSERDGLKRLTMPVPVPLPIAVRPTVATGGGWLFVASTDALLDEVAAVKAGQRPGLKGTPEFARLSQGLPAEGNRFAFFSTNIGSTVVRIQKSALEAAATTADAAQLAALRQYLGDGASAHSYFVSANTDQGWVTTGNGNQAFSKALAGPALIFPIGVLAGIAVPNFVKARSTAQENAIINNLRQIDAAKEQWALENRKSTGARVTEANIAVYIRGGMPKSVAGERYVLNAIGQPPVARLTRAVGKHPAGTDLKMP